MKHYCMWRLLLSAATVTLTVMSTGQEFTLVEIASGIQGAENKAQGINTAGGIAGYFLSNEKPTARRLGYAPGFGDDIDRVLDLGLEGRLAACYALNDAATIAGSVTGKNAKFPGAAYWIADKDNKKYTFTDLHGPLNIGNTNVSGSEAYGIDNSQDPKIVGGFFSNSPVMKGFHWDTKTNKGTIIEPASIMVDTIRFGKPAKVPYSWPMSLGWRINANGEVCGWQFFQMNSGQLDKFFFGGTYERPNAFYWKLGNPQVTPLLPSDPKFGPNQTVSHAYGINDSSYIVGFQQHPQPKNARPPVLPTVWTDKTKPGLVLSVKVKDKPKTDGACFAINKGGDVVGTAFNFGRSGPTDKVAVRWKKKDGKDEWEDPVDLNTITDFGNFKDYTMVEANGINTDGQICGWGQKIIDKGKKTQRIEIFGFKLVKKKLAP